MLREHLGGIHLTHLAANDGGDHDRLGVLPEQIPHLQQCAVKVSGADVLGDIEDGGLQYRDHHVINVRFGQLLLIRIADELAELSGQGGHGAAGL